MEKHLQHLKFIYEQAYSIMLNYNKGEMNLVPHSYLELLSRVWAASKGLNKLIDGIEDEPELEFSAGLVIRTMILDFFVSLRGYDIKERAIKAGKQSQQVKDEVEAYFKTILGGGLKLSANHFSRMESKGHITEAELHNVLNNMTIKYSLFLQPYTNNKSVVTHFGEAPKNNELFDQISGNPELKNFAKHFDTYNLYSKYEHFSIMSFDAFRRDVEAQTKTLQEMVEILILHVFKIVGMLLYYLNDEFLKEKHFKIGEYIGKEIFALNEEEIRQMMANS